MFAVLVRAQCPDRPTVYHRITELKHSEVSIENQFQELNGYLASFKICPSSPDTVLAYLMQRLGALYGLQKKFQEAVAFSLRSISIETSNPNPVSKADFLVRVYHNLQMFYDSLHMSVKKIDAVDSCVNIAIRSGRINGEVVYNTWQRAYYNLVVGDYQRCLDYSNIGDGITKYCSDSAERDFMETGFFYMRVNSLTLLRRFPVAQIILENKIKVYRSRNQEKSCGIFYNQLAEISTQKHHYDSSLYFLSKSLECNQKAACMYCCKQSYNNIGFLYQSRLNDPVRALPYYFKALACKNNMDQYHDQDVIETLNIYDNIAKVYAQLSKFDSALFYYDKAFVQSGQEWMIKKYRSFLRMN